MQDVVVKSNTLLLGIEGEKNIVRYKFPISQWITAYGSGGNFTLIHKRPKDIEGHPCATTSDASYVYWIPAQAEMQFSGKGKLEFQYAVGTSIKKSQIYDTIINVSLDGSGTPPQPWSGWVEQVAAYRDDAKMWAVGTTDTTKEQYNNSAKDWSTKAETASTHYPYINSTNKHWMVWNVQTSAYVDTGVVAEGSNIQSDWNQSDSTQPDYIKNKPTIPSLNDYYTKAETDAKVGEVADDLDEHVDNTTVHVTENDKTSWNAKYSKPNDGIPKTDLTSSVQTSLGKADTALQEHQSLSAYRTSSAQDVIDNGKQATISDLDTIRSGAALGATALQNVPNTYRTSADQDTIDSTKVDKLTTSGQKVYSHNGATQGEMSVDNASSIPLVTSVSATSPSDSKVPTEKAVRDYVGGQFELIETIVLTEDTLSITRTQDPQGNAYNFKKLLLLTESLLPSVSCSAHFKINNMNVSYITDLVKGGSNQWAECYSFIDGGRLFSIRKNSAAASNLAVGAISTISGGFGRQSASSITSIDINSSNTVSFPAGTKFEIYAVRN